MTRRFRSATLGLLLMGGWRQPAGLIAIAAVTAMLGSSSVASGAPTCSTLPVTEGVRLRVAFAFERHFGLPQRSVTWLGGHAGRCGSTRWAMARIAARPGAMQRFSDRQRVVFQDGPWAFRGRRLASLRYVTDGVGYRCDSTIPPRAMMRAWHETCEADGQRVPY